MHKANILSPLASVSVRTNSAGQVVSHDLFDAYGTARQLGTSEYIHYNGQWGYLRLFGLYLCTYRFYDEAKGRWVQRDPIGYDGGINLYGYCGDGPVGRVDPRGRYAEKIIKIGIGAAAADGPVIPIGDIIGVTIILGSVLWEVCDGLQNVILGGPFTGVTGAQTEIINGRPAKCTNDINELMRWVNWANDPLEFSRRLHEIKQGVGRRGLPIGMHDNGDVFIRGGGSEQDSIGNIFE